ncbi:MAG: segregation/condensation protein A [Candidatus Pacearchaeota archaeon]
MEKEGDASLIEKNNFERSAIERIGQEQIHGLLFEEKLSWQQIIYDLIRTEQLDPWDIDISLLANKFLDKVRQLEEANFFVSSQVLLAASLLLRLKSEILLNRYIPSLDNVLFGKKSEEKKYNQERIELDEEIPGLVLRTPLPRFRKVTLEELMNALGHAIRTENRRIRKVIIAKQQELETAIAFPRRKINVKDRMKLVYSKLKNIFSTSEEKLAFSKFSHRGSEEKLADFISLLHLDNQHKIWLEQHKHLDEIWILLKHLYEKQNAESLEIMKKEAEEAIEQLIKEESEMRKQRALEEKEEKQNERKKSVSEGEKDEDEESYKHIEELTGFDEPVDF